MHALRWEIIRDLTKFGTAIAASRPMIATTIIISTRVNAAPDPLKAKPSLTCFSGTRFQRTSLRGLAEEDKIGSARTTQNIANTFAIIVSSDSEPSAKPSPGDLSNCRSNGLEDCSRNASLLVARDRGVEDPGRLKQ